MTGDDVEALWSLSPEGRDMMDVALGGDHVKE